MFIFKRYKCNGKTVGYLVGVNKAMASKQPVHKCIQYHKIHKFKNAILLDTGEFKAKAGWVIPTEIINTSIKKTKINTTITHKPIIQNQNSIMSKSLTDETKPKYTLESDVAGHEFVKMCRQIRAAIRLNKLTVDTSEHDSNDGDNTQYFKLIELCGNDVEQFIIDYLFCMQPCTLAYKSKAESKDNNNLTILLDLGYKVNLYIKFLGSKDIVVSFHDDNFRGKVMTKSSKNKLFSEEEHEYSYILLNEKTARTARYFDIKLSRGLSFIQQNIEGEYCADDLIKVRTEDLYNMMKRVMNSAILDICTTCGINADKDLKLVKAKMQNPKLNEFSFTSYGGTTLNKLSLLIDLYKMTSSDCQGKQTILTLVGYVLEDIVFEFDKLDLLEALRDRYKHEPKNLVLETAYDLLEGGGEDA